jgi:hypothetical protein
MKNNSTIEQDENRNPDGKFKVGNNANPTGKGGFQERPEDINYGGRPKNEQRFGYWLQFFKDLKSKEFVEYFNNRPQDEMYIAEVIAYERVKNARKDLAEYKEVADRTEGRSVQTMKHQGDLIEQVKVEIVNGTQPQGN